MSNFFYERRTSKLIVRASYEHRTSIVRVDKVLLPIYIHVSFAIVRATYAHRTIIVGVENCILYKSTYLFLTSHSHFTPLVRALVYCLRLVCEQQNFTKFYCSYEQLARTILCDQGFTITFIQSVN